MLALDPGNHLAYHLILGFGTDPLVFTGFRIGFQYRFLDQFQGRRQGDAPTAVERREQLDTLHGAPHAVVVVPGNQFAFVAVRLSCTKSSMMSIASGDSTTRTRGLMIVHNSLSVKGCCDNRRVIWS